MVFKLIIKHQNDFASGYYGIFSGFFLNIEIKEI